jgi:hypothetical protein
VSDVREITLWSRPGATVTTRVLVGGDVIPRLASVPADADSWRRVAGGLAPLLAGIDAAVVNLECPLTRVDTPRPKPSGTCLRADPVAAALLGALGVRVAGLANNHSHDQGPAGVRETEQLLSGLGIAAPGASTRRWDPPPVSIVPLGGRAKVGVYAASMDVPERARRRRAGVETFTVRRAEQAAARLRSAGATLRIALLHLGTEGVDHPHPNDVEQMNAITNDFHLVAACHSHRIGGYRAGRGGGPAAVQLLGLGSLVSTALYGEREREALAAVVGLDAGGAPARIAVVPLWLEGEGSPVLPSPERAASIGERFHRLAAELDDGTHVSAYHRVADRDVGRRQLDHARRLWREQGLAGLVRKLRRTRVRHLAQLLRSVRGDPANDAAGSRSPAPRR